MSTAAAAKFTKQTFVKAMTDAASGIVSKRHFNRGWGTAQLVGRELGTLEAMVDYGRFRAFEALAEQVSEGTLVPRFGKASIAHAASEWAERYRAKHNFNPEQGMGQLTSARVELAVDFGWYVALRSAAQSALNGSLLAA